jgi:hypothetical protein
MNDTLSSVLRKLVQGSLQVGNSVMDWWINIEKFMNMLTGSDRVDLALDAFNEYSIGIICFHTFEIMRMCDVRRLITTERGAHREFFQNVHETGKWKV